jgi:hypothetical protein
MKNTINVIASNGTITLYAPEWIGRNVKSRLGNGVVTNAYHNSWGTVSLTIQTPNGVVHHHSNFVTVI